MLNKISKEEEQEYQSRIDIGGTPYIPLSSSNLPTQFNIWHNLQSLIPQWGSSAEDEKAQKEISPLVVYSPFFICSSN